MPEMLTEDEFKRLEAHLDHLENTKIAEVAEEIKRARGFGDISENAEYDEAKNSQARLFSEIIELRERLLKAEVVKPSKSTKVVGIGSIVDIKEVGGSKKELSLKVTSIVEPGESVVTPQSPLGSALLGSKVGDVIEVKARLPWKAKVIAIRTK